MRAPDFWTTDGTAARLLDPLGRFFGLASTLRQRLIKPTHARVPVICVGNLTVGGAGKTPTAIAVIRRLQAMGACPHALTRGYGGMMRGPLKVDPDRHDAVAVGDEPLLLARVTETWVSEDRVAGARAAVAAGASHIVMDDGMQNPHLAKDLSLLVVDGAVGFGNGRLMPAGPLREPIDKALSRIDAVIVIGRDRVGIDAVLPADQIKLSAHLLADGDLDLLRDRRVLAFAGIGRPEKFYETLEGLGADVVERRSFSDHHCYRAREIETLLALARQFDAVPITTEKDHVRLPPNLANSVEKLPIRLQFHEPRHLDRLLSTVRSNFAAGAK